MRIGQEVFYVKPVATTKGLHVALSGTVINMDNDRVAIWTGPTFGFWFCHPDDVYESRERAESVALSKSPKQTPVTLAVSTAVEVGDGGGL